MPQTTCKILGTRNLERDIIKQLDPIEELNDLYLEEEDSSRIVELGNTDLDFGFKDREVDPNFEL